MMALGGQGDLFYLHLVRDLASIMDDRMEDSGDGSDGDIVMGEGETENEVGLLEFPSNMSYSFHFLLLSFCFSRPGVLHLLNSGAKQLLNYISLTQKKALPPTIATELQEETNAAATKWTLQFRDIPEAGNRRPVTLRLMADTPITAGDPMAFMKAMEYTYVPSPSSSYYPPTQPTQLS